MVNETAVRVSPRDAADVAEILRSHPRAVEPLGGGSKRSLGGPVQADVLDLSALAGVLDYEPDELVLTACAATPLAAVDALLAEHGQRLAFEPPNFGPLLAVAAAQTLGGVLAANLSGSRRLTAGAARDHFLGFKAVTGDGLPFKGGGRVVKNVTGYDLPKLLAGSWGTLAVLTEVSLRVVPAAETETTLIVPAASIEKAVAMSTAAVSSSYEVSAAAFDPVRGVALRIEGFEASVQARVRGLVDVLGRPEAERLDGRASQRFWQALGSAAALADQPFVWRISVPPSEAARIVAALEPERCLLDWAGGLVWAGFATLDADRVRGALREGHASLWKAPAAERADAPAFQTRSLAFAQAARRLKAAFDPNARLNPGRLSFG
ncbi:MAG TPA: FAD-binding protein [Gammaproteobacteria bacterium]|nr:FAD-binding protein [Gammaproteobacteria bacterium]